MSAATPSVQPVVKFNISAVPEGRESIAQLVVDLFAEAGFGALQQLAALANAIGVSDLNPAAKSAPPGQAVGLFQLSRTALGAGHTVAELEDPATNISLVRAEAEKFAAFAAATSLEQAVSAFVRGVARPANPAGESARRLKIAERLVT
jgi:hypothetical protein